MSEFIKQKQIENLVSDLAARALDSQVLKKANNLSDVTAATARVNLDVYSKLEVQNLIAGVDNAHSVASLAERDALTGLKVSDRIFVKNDGDSKWALYIVTAITTGTGSTSTYEKIADEDLFANALTAEAIKAAYESNPNTNEFSDAEEAKLANINVTQPVDLDQMESTLASTTSTANSALSTANAASSAASAAQSSANNALSVANSKEDEFHEAIEIFTTKTGAANATVDLDLSHPVAEGFTPQLYFNGVNVKNVTFATGNTQISFTVPYILEATDTLKVVYTWR